MGSRYRPVFRVPSQHAYFGAAAVIHELNDPKYNPVPRAARRKAEREAKRTRQ